MPGPKGDIFAQFLAEAERELALLRLAAQQTPPALSAIGHRDLGEGANHLLREMIAEQQRFVEKCEAIRIGSKQRGFRERDSNLAAIAAPIGGSSIRRFCISGEAFFGTQRGFAKLWCFDHRDLGRDLGGKSTVPKNILVVEDDTMIGMLLEEYIDMLGHRAVAVVDSVEAALARIAEGGIDAALVDVHLANGELGDPVAVVLAKMDIPFLVATGGFVGESGGAWGGKPILAKPFTLETLRAGLDRLWVTAAPRGEPR